MKIDLSNKLAVVTGASGELGRVIARTLASCGADVVVHYHQSKEKAEQVAEDIRAMGRRTMTFQGDVTVEKDVFAMRDAVSKQLGRPDIIVNNAVIQCYPWLPVLEMPPEGYESQFRSCVLHNVLMAKAFVPAMIEKKWGRVVAINTECTMLASAGMSAYTSGKAGQDRVIRCLAREVGEHQITVNQVAPGWMISDKYRGTPEEKQPGYEKNVPLRRRGYDQDIANAVAFLASDLAAFITGAYIPVCGGNVMPAI
jgi:3-oxoacyl-[acyl-carrier protein] reductase